MLDNRLFIITVLALSIVAFGASSVEAKKGGGGKPPSEPTPVPVPLDGGWIYHSAQTPDKEIHRSAPDGSSNAEVIGAPADYGCPLPGQCFVGKPSDQTHDGDRWYVSHAVQTLDVVFPNIPYNGAGYAYDIDAVREGSGSGVTLLDGKASCIHSYHDNSLMWTTDGAGARDGAISWIGTQWADLDGDPNGDCESYVSAGIFRAELVYDASGAITGATAPVLALEMPYDSVNSYAWSPDAASIAYTSGGLYVAAVGSPAASHSLVAEGGYGDVDWSHDGTRIAFVGRDAHRNPRKAKHGTLTVSPDGSGLTLVVQRADDNFAHFRPSWSPADTHLTYMEREFPSSGFGAPTDALRVVQANGAGDSVIVTESAGLDIVQGLGWVE